MISYAINKKVLHADRKCQCSQFFFLFKNILSACTIGFVYVYVNVNFAKFVIVRYLFYIFCEYKPIQVCHS